MIRWRDYLEDYGTLYDKFKVNREYKKTSFENEEDYMKAQERLLKKIDEMNEAVLKEVKEIVEGSFPDVKVVAYDSRMMNPSEERAGDLLVSGGESAVSKLEVSKWLESATGCKWWITSLESLPEDVREKIVKRVSVS